MFQFYAHVEILYFYSCVDVQRIVWPSTDPLCYTCRIGCIRNGQEIDYRKNLVFVIILAEFMTMVVCILICDKD